MKIVICLTSFTLCTRSTVSLVGNHNCLISVSYIFCDDSLAKRAVLFAQCVGGFQHLRLGFKLRISNGDHS